MRQTCSPAPLLTWSRDFPAVPSQAREARLFLAALLGGRRDADEAVLCLSELVGNACLHSRSREPGGRFTVRAQLRGEQLRVEVRDGGGQWGESRCPDDLHGRGLVIVSRLARRCGRSGDGQSGWRVWFEMDCPPDCLPGTRPVCSSPSPGQRKTGRSRGLPSRPMMLVLIKQLLNRTRGAPGTRLPGRGTCGREPPPGKGRHAGLLS
jgi:serine/threonine-protein kinase RsbW